MSMACAHTLSYRSPHRACNVCINCACRSPTGRGPIAHAGRAPLATEVDPCRGMQTACAEMHENMGVYMHTSTACPAFVWTAAWAAIAASTPVAHSKGALPLGGSVDGRRAARGADTGGLSEQVLSESCQNCVRARVVPRRATATTTPSSSSSSVLLLLPLLHGSLAQRGERPRKRRERESKTASVTWCHCWTTPPSSAGKPSVAGWSPSTLAAPRRADTPAATMAQPEPLTIAQKIAIRKKEGMTWYAGTPERRTPRRIVAG